MTDAEYQTLILGELGLSADTFALANIEAWWDLYDSKATVSTYLQYLYAKKHAIFYILGSASSKYDVQIGFDQFKKSKVFDNWAKLLKLLDGEINNLDPEADGVADFICTTPTGGLPDRLEEYADLIDLFPNLAYFLGDYRCLLG